eukprot:CAMPEP_0119410552 /NCGR_PEP_ID=MMETSP1335-20130426/3541_1 /TAXON_ID=259385 /ORGANISM="Chrysoculter rhomboideus, Strain RCC1486" /LENGTH=57 /DNA_ID=CAMNT_0007435095 /DNA_START=161 /DNA_END=334 /DNA_ORIENTATION=-
MRGVEGRLNALRAELERIRLERHLARTRIEGGAADCSEDGDDLSDDESDDDAGEVTA